MGGSLSRKSIIEADVCSPVEDEVDDLDIQKTIVDIAGGQFLFIGLADWNRWNESSNNSFGRLSPSATIPDALDVTLADGILTVTVLDLDQLFEICPELYDDQEAIPEHVLAAPADHCILQIIKFTLWNRGCLVSETGGVTPAPKLINDPNDIPDVPNSKHASSFSAWWWNPCRRNAGPQASPTENTTDIVEEPPAQENTDTEQDDNNNPPSQTVEAKRPTVSPFKRPHQPSFGPVVTEPEPDPLASVPPVILAPLDVATDWAANLGSFKDQVASGTSDEDDCVENLPPSLPPAWHKFALSDEAVVTEETRPPKSVGRKATKHCAPKSAARPRKSPIASPPRTRGRLTAAAVTPSGPRLKRAQAEKIVATTKRHRKVAEKDTETFGLTVPRQPIK